MNKKWGGKKMTVEIKNQDLINYVLDEIRNRKDEFEAKRHVPKDMIQQLKQLGVYRAHVPQCFGGAGTSAIRIS